MLFAIVKRTDKPIKIVTWFYKEPGKLDHVFDESGKLWRPYSLIPIGYKRYRKMVDDARVKQFAAEATKIKKAIAEAEDATFEVIDSRQDTKDLSIMDK